MGISMPKTGDVGEGYLPSFPHILDATASAKGYLHISGVLCVERKGDDSSHRVSPVRPDLVRHSN